MFSQYLQPENKKRTFLVVIAVALFLLAAGIAVYAYLRSGTATEGHHDEVMSLTELQSLNGAVNAFGPKDTFKDEDIDRYLNARLSRLAYIASHKKETENYLTAYIHHNGTQEYKEVLKEYVLSDFKVGDEGKTPVPEYLTQAKGEDVKNKTNYFQITASYYLSPYDTDAVVFVDGTLAVVTLVNDAYSGAYNLDTYVYTVKVENGKVEKNIPTLVFYNKKTKRAQKVSNTWSMSESNSVRQLDGTNAGYDEKRKEIFAEPHKPFGMYPCSQVQYYDVYFDRLVLHDTETPEYCVGRDFSSPGAGDFLTIPKGQEGSVFDKQKTLYQATPAELDMARSVAP